MRKSETALHFTIIEWIDDFLVLVAANQQATITNFILLFKEHLIDFGVKPECPTLYVGLNLSFNAQQAEWILSAANPNGTALNITKPEIEYTSIPVRRMQHSIGSVPQRKQFGLVKGNSFAA